MCRRIHVAKHETQWRRTKRGKTECRGGIRHDTIRNKTKETIRTSDSVRSMRSLLSSVRFSEDLFSSSPSSLKTLTSSSLPRSSPPPLLLTCGIIAGTRATATVFFPVSSRIPHLPIGLVSRAGEIRLRRSRSRRRVREGSRVAALSVGGDFERRFADDSTRPGAHSEVPIAIAYHCSHSFHSSRLTEHGSERALPRAYAIGGKTS